MTYDYRMDNPLLQPQKIKDDGFIKQGFQLSPITYIL